MGNQPFSAPRPRSLPTSTPNQDINGVMANWQTQLQPLVGNAAPQATPLNFSVTNSRGGLALSWSPVSGADGYEILRSTSGSFTDDLQVIPVKNANQSSYFDSLGGNAKSAHYRIRTTSGTVSNPQSQRGPESGVVSHTSIDASDTKSVPVTKSDVATTDISRANARKGNYGAIKPSALGSSGGALVGSGTTGGSGTSGGTPATGATSFAAIGTGENQTANMTVGPGAFLGPDGSNLGTVAANQLGTLPVSPLTPNDQQGLIFSAATGELQYGYPDTVVVASTNYLAAVGNFVVCSGTFTVTVPLVAPNANAHVGVKNNFTGVITVATSTTSDTIEGSSSLTINYQGSSLDLLADGISNWIIR